MGPFRAAADAARLYFQNPLNPFSHTPFGRSVAAAAELFERTTRRYGKPEFGHRLDRGPRRARAGGRARRLGAAVLPAPPFREDGARQRARHQPKLLIVAPMSGHYATLLRGTVETMLPDHDVYITDWADARMVPLADGRFDLDDYIDYVISMLHVLGRGRARHGGVPALGAGARRGGADGDARRPPHRRRR